MKMIEKFSEVFLDRQIESWENQCEKIAEDFAIGFAEWLIKKEREHPNKIIRIKQLLEIYKNETTNK